jgi:hypothetical protein
MMMMHEGLIRHPEITAAERVVSFINFFRNHPYVDGLVTSLCMKNYEPGDEQCLELVLVQYGGNIHEYNHWRSFRMQGIHFACRVDNIECLNVLIAHGADVNGRSEEHWLPIDYSIFYNARRCIQRLIEAGSQQWDSSIVVPEFWVVSYIEQRNRLRQAAIMLMVAQRRGILKGQDRHLVRFIAQLVWKLRFTQS